MGPPQSNAEGEKYRREAAPANEEFDVTTRLVDGSEFLHIPKTGGTWVESVLQESSLIEASYGHEHADFDRNLFQSVVSVGDHLGEAAKIARHKLVHGRRKTPPDRPVFRFCFVRHPLSWYESWWRFMSDQDWHDWGVQNSRAGWHPNALLNGLGSEDFNAFVQNVINARPGYVSELMFAYTKPGISFIGKTENLRRDLARVLCKLGLDHDPALIEQKPRLMVSRSTASPIEWDPQLRQVLMRLELPALVHFGYLTAEQQAEMGITPAIRPHPALSLEEK